MQKFENADLIVGLARTVCKLITEMVEQEKLDRERAIKGFRDFANQQDDEPHNQATRFFSDQIVKLLEADPSRPPPAPVIRLPERY